MPSILFYSIQLGQRAVGPTGKYALFPSFLSYFFCDIIDGLLNYKIKCMFGLNLFIGQSNFWIKYVFG